VCVRRTREEHLQQLLTDFGHCADTTGLSDEELHRLAGLIVKCLPVHSAGMNALFRQAFVALYNRLFPATTRSVTVTLQEFADADILLGAHLVAGSLVSSIDGDFLDMLAACVNTDMNPTCLFDIKGSYLSLSCVPVSRRDVWDWSRLLAWDAGDHFVRRLSGTELDDVVQCPYLLPCLKALSGGDYLDSIRGMGWDAAVAVMCRSGVILALRFWQAAEGFYSVVCLWLLVVGCWLLVVGCC